MSVLGAPAAGRTAGDAAERELEDDLRACGVVDTHYHIGPELLPRRYDVMALADAAREWRATLVLKNHTYPTTPLAALARARFGVTFVGSVVLNRFIGGLNPDAVAGAVSGNRADPTTDAASDPPVVVWMPTVHAASHLRIHGYAFDPRWAGRSEHVPSGSLTTNETPVVAFDDDLRPRPELMAVLEELVRHRCRLATGHLSAAEIMRLVPLAVEVGVPSILITHPHYASVALSDEQLRALVRYPNVFVEHCFAIHTIERVPLAAIAESIRATGTDQVVLATDFGQISSDPFPEGSAHFARAIGALLEQGIGRDELLGMFSRNGARALGLSEQ